MTRISSKSSIVIALIVFSLCLSIQRIPDSKSAVSPVKIVLDYSHGQEFDTGLPNVDHLLEGNLTGLGYEVVWARGGINSSVLEGATGLIFGSIFGSNTRIASVEVDAVSDWFAQGKKLLWVGCKGDYGDSQIGQFINDNMTLLLDAVGSHVYPESNEIDDYESNCGECYRTVANITNHDLFVQDMVSGVNRVLVHGTCALYGSNSSTPGQGINPVPLESTSIDNVYPLLFTSPASISVECNDPPPLVHTEFQTGPFTVCSMEIKAGISETGVIIVSGVSPYGNNRPMYIDSYYGYSLDGYRFVNQAIDKGIFMALSLGTTSDTSTTSPTSPESPQPDDMMFIGATVSILGLGVATALIILRRWR